MPKVTETPAERQKAFDEAARKYQAVVAKARQASAPLAKKAFAEQDAKRARKEKVKPV